MNDFPQVKCPLGNLKEEERSGNNKEIRWRAFFLGSIVRLLQLHDYYKAIRIWLQMDASIRRPKKN